MKIEDARATLLNYVKDIPDQEAYWRIKPLIEKSGHKDFINSFVKYCLMKKEMKNCAVWLYGCPNSGKTTVLNYLK